MASSPVIIKENKVPGGWSTESLQKVYVCERRGERKGGNGKYKTQIARPFKRKCTTREFSETIDFCNLNWEFTNRVETTHNENHKWKWNKVVKGLQSSVRGERLLNQLKENELLRWKLSASNFWACSLCLRVKLSIMGQNWVLSRRLEVTSFTSRLFLGGKQGEENLK